MSEKKNFKITERRTVLRAALAVGAVNLAPAFLRSARGEQSVKIGFCDPLTGTYAELGKNELIGTQLAVEQINAKGGILGRPVELLVEDSTSGDAGTAVQKTRKLIERDNVNFVLGNVNSALSLAMAQVTNEKRVLHIVQGGHTDAVTGANCHWNVFRVCNTTQTEGAAVASVLISKAGKKWYYITADYAFGHTLQAGMEKAAAPLGGIKVGADLFPLGSTDFSSYLIKAQAARPDVIIFMCAGDDQINAIKQAAQFGLHKTLHLGGAQLELEVLEGLPPEARVGYWVFEWYWKQPGVAHVAEFVEATRKKTGKVPTARTWFGFASTWSCALAANTAKSLDTVKMAKALSGMTLPPEIGLMPHLPYFRAGQNQSINTLYVGHAQPQGSTPEDLFNVTDIVKGADVADSVEASGCKMVWPT